MPPVPPTPRVKLRATATRRVPRARSSAAAEAAEPEPNMKLSRAIFVMLLLHVVAVGGIFAFSLVKERDPNRRAADGSIQATEAEDAQVPRAPLAKVTAVETERSKAEAPNGVTRPGVHVVRQGETLRRIANEKGVTMDAIVAANGASIVTDGVRPDQELKMPDKIPAPPPRSGGPMTDAMHLISGQSGDAPSTPASAAAKGPRLPPDSGKTYVIGKGESAYTIAQKLKVSSDALMRLNGIDDPKKLRPGQKLRVPAKAKS